MDKDRIKGMADQAKGAVKEAAGKITGDKKLETEGTMDKAKGKVREIGTHEELIAKGGMYRTLYELQFQEMNAA